jgi:hypothetical protein
MKPLHCDHCGHAKYLGSFPFSIESDDMSDRSNWIDVHCHGADGFCLRYSSVVEDYASYPSANILIGCAMTGSDMAVAAVRFLMSRHNGFILSQSNQYNTKQKGAK